MTIRIPLRWVERLLTFLRINAYFIFGDPEVVPGTGLAQERPLEAVRIIIGEEARRKYLSAQIGSTWGRDSDA